MIGTFGDYTKEPQSIPFEKMADIHGKMVEAIGNDPDTLECYNDLLQAAAKYANIRALWPTMAREEKMERDDRRTSLHNSVITNLNLLSRLLKMQGKDVSWRDELGYEEEGYGRKALGDFACYLAFVSGLNAR